MFLNVSESILISQKYNRENDYRPGEVVKPTLSVSSEISHRLRNTIQRFLAFVSKRIQIHEWVYI